MTKSGSKGRFAQVAALAAIFVLSACGGSSSTRSTTPRTNVKPWTGVWKTSFGGLVIVQDGARIVGKYTYNRGRKKRTGKLEGKLLRDGIFGFRWVEIGGGSRGTLGLGGFVMSNSGNSFRGKWGVGKSATNGGVWTGVRMNVRISPAFRNELLGRRGAADPTSRFHKLKVTLKTKNGPRAILLAALMRDCYVSIKKGILGLSCGADGAMAVQQRGTELSFHCRKTTMTMAKCKRLKASLIAALSLKPISTPRFMGQTATAGASPFAKSMKVGAALRCASTMNKLGTEFRCGDVKVHMVLFKRNHTVLFCSAKNKPTCKEFAKRWWAAASLVK